MDQSLLLVSFYVQPPKPLFDNRVSDVDRLPLISSCIINVDQDVDEPWPIEVYDHDGNAYNVTMEPGDLVLYESSTILHGRPFPMKGRYYVSVNT